MAFEQTKAHSSQLNEIKPKWQICQIIIEVTRNRGTKPNIKIPSSRVQSPPCGDAGQCGRILTIRVAGYLSSIAGDPFQIGVGHRQKPVPTFPDHALEDTRILWSI
jgi:hypothetical protein